MRNLLQSTAYNLMVFMTDAADHIAGKTGLTLAISASKAGAAFAGISPSVTERGDGWYSLALTTAHTDTVGDLAIRCTGTGADPTDLVVQVEAAPAVAPSASTIATAVRSELATELGRIDAATTTRLAAADYDDAAAVLAAMNAAPPDVNIEQIKGIDLQGTGVDGDSFRPV
jgi:hypothetical protein